VPDFDGDDPPASCIVAENTAVSANWDTQETSGGYVAPSGTATVDSGLPEVYSDSSAGDTSGSASKSGYRITVQSGASFSVSCAPTAYAYTATGPAEANVMYVVFNTPVTVQLDGVTMSNGTQNIPIGQGIRCSLTAGDYTASTWSWAISGDPFAGFAVDENNPGSGHAQPITNEMLHLASVTYFYRSTGLNSMDAGSKQWWVTCVATATDGVGNPLQITGQAHVNVWQSAHTFVPDKDSVNVWPGPNQTQYLRAGHNGPRGVTWTASVTIPPLFGGGANSGKWIFNQIVTPSFSYTINGQETDSPDYGVTGLDSRFVYDGKWDADGGSHTSGDSPGIGPLTAGESGAAMNVIAQTWMLYQPPPGGAGLGTTWVPLHELGWTAKGQAINNNGTWIGKAVGDGIVLTDYGPVSVLPDWSHIDMGGAF